MTAHLPGSTNFDCSRLEDVYLGWQRQAFMPVGEITNLIWHAVTSAGTFSSANISSTT